MIETDFERFRYSLCQLTERLDQLHCLLWDAAQPRDIVVGITKADGSYVSRPDRPSVEQVWDEEELELGPDEWVPDPSNSSKRVTIETLKDKPAWGLRIKRKIPGFSSAMLGFDSQLACDPDDREQPWAEIIGAIQTGVAETSSQAANLRPQLAKISQGIVRCAAARKRTKIELTIAVAQIALSAEAVGSSRAFARIPSCGVQNEQGKTPRLWNWQFARREVVRQLGPFVEDLRFDVENECDLILGLPGDPVLHQVAAADRVSFKDAVAGLPKLGLSPTPDSTLRRWMKDKARAPLLGVDPIGHATSQMILLDGLRTMKQASPRRQPPRK